MLAGVVSQILLSSGTIFVSYGVGTGLSHPMELCGLSCLYYYVGDVMPYFLIGMVMLGASSIGFLLSLRFS